MTNTYTIKEISNHFGISISTIRFYDKKGLLPFVSKNESGYRIFSESDMNFIKTICCLKDTGMPLKDIKNYINYCMLGTSTITNRKKLLLDHKKQILVQQKILKDSLEEINKKIQNYSSPNAVNLISAQINYTKEEKKQLNLKDPFKN